MHLGFSYIGLIFLIMLMIPNLYWTKNQPKDYEKYVHNENKILLLFERAGEVLVTCLLLIFSDFNIQGITAWMIWLIAAFVCERGTMERFPYQCDLCRNFLCVLWYLPEKNGGNREANDIFRFTFSGWNYNRGIYCSQSIIIF